MSCCCCLNASPSAGSAQFIPIPYIVHSHTNRNHRQFELCIAFDVIVTKKNRLFSVVDTTKMLSLRISILNNLFKSAWIFY